MIPRLVRQINKILFIAALAMMLVFTGCSAPAQTGAETAPEPTVTAKAPTPFTPRSTSTLEPTVDPFVGSSRRVEVLFFESSNYPKSITTRIYLPPGYDPDRDKPYPVLLMLHGSYADGSQWEDLGLLTVADELITAGAIFPLVIVMPEEMYSMQPFNETSYGGVLVDELLPRLYRQYNLCRDRKCTAIGGLSRGAAWAARLAFTRWDIFGVAGLHSMPASFLPLPEWIKAIPFESLPRLYMDIGIEDVGYKNAKEFDALLTRLEIPHDWVEQPGVHAEEYWSAHVQDYLRWYDKALEQ